MLILNLFLKELRVAYVLTINSLVCVDDKFSKPVVLYRGKKVQFTILSKQS